MAAFDIRRDLLRYDAPDREDFPGSILKYQDFEVRADDHGFYLERITDYDEHVGIYWYNAQEWTHVVYGDEWDAGMTYYEVNCIANESSDENFQVFSSRQVER